MRQDTLYALKKMREDNCTCVICRGNEIYFSRERGVAPLLAWIQENKELQGFSAADRVVGKAAAFLYVILGVSEVWAEVMSETACEVLTRHGILFCCETMTPAIRNRTGTGLCPMEEAVWGIDEPTQAIRAIRKRFDAMAH